MKKSIKHILGFPIGILFGTLLALTGWFQWNKLMYNDEIFGHYFEVGKIPCQSIIVISISIVAYGFFEFFQQRKMIEKPTIADTRMDIAVGTITTYLGYLCSLYIIILLS